MIADWIKIYSEFDNHCQFPNGLEATDGKPITILSGLDYGSFYFNYKGFNSIVLMEIVYNYKFIYVDIGVNVGISNRGVFDECF